MRRFGCSFQVLFVFRGFFGSDICNLQLQYIIAMRCRVILGLQVAAVMLHVVKLRFFAVGSGAEIGRIVVVRVALGVSRAVLACCFVCM